jgi:FAD/FMN-containing dehydrogenase
MPEPKEADVNAFAHAYDEAAAPAAERQHPDFVTALRFAAARRPASPLRILSAAEVALAVAHANDEGLEVELGDGPIDGKLVLDLSGMKRIVIDAYGRTARAQPGVTRDELEAACAAHGLSPEAPIGARILGGLVIERTYRLV